VPIRTPLGGLLRKLLLVLPLACVCAPNPGHAEERYAIDQRFGEIEFSVDHIGLFTSHGEFRHWDGNLSLDPSTPEQLRVDVSIDANSIAMAYEDGAAILRSPPFFDVANYPEIHFTSIAVVPVSPNHYVIRGQLEIRGITQPQELDATLLGRHVDTALHAEVADFAITGTLKRSMFGMIADGMFISDTVNILIRAHIKLANALLHAG
jgi:polyisoprenoid-binding protein YceI